MCGGCMGVRAEGHAHGPFCTGGPEEEEGPVDTVVERTCEPRWINDNVTAYGFRAGVSTGAMCGFDLNGIARGGIPQTES